MNATVMYRRKTFERVGGFDTSLKACEDYDLYLRIARTIPVSCHHVTIAEYRQHDANMSRNNALMLKSAIHVLRTQKQYLRSNEKRAYRTGLTFWQTLFGDPLRK